MPEGMGWTFISEKSTVQPTQRLLFLGCLVDSTEQSLILPKEKVCRLLKEVVQSTSVVEKSLLPAH